MVATVPRGVVQPSSRWPSDSVQDSLTTKHDLALSVSSAKTEKPSLGPSGISPESAALIELLPLSLFPLVSSHLSGLEAKEFLDEHVGLTGSFS